MFLEAWEHQTWIPQVSSTYMVSNHSLDGYMWFHGLMWNPICLDFVGMARLDPVWVVLGGRDTRRPDTPRVIAMVKQKSRQRDPIATVYQEAVAARRLMQRWHDTPHSFRNAQGQSPPRRPKWAFALIERWLSGGSGAHVRHQRVPFEQGFILMNRPALADAGFPDSYLHQRSKPLGTYFSEFLDLGFQEPVLIPRAPGPVSVPPPCGHGVPKRRREPSPDEGAGAPPRRRRGAPRR